MHWETDKLYIKLSDSLNKYGIGPHIIKSFHEYGITRSGDKNPIDYLIGEYSQEPFYNNLIPHCSIYPKFEYESHLDKIRRIKVSKNLGASLSNRKQLIIIFFVSIDAYDKILSSNELDIKDYFGHNVIDLLFFQTKKFASIVGARCVVVWIGIRDCLSQDSLFSEGTRELKSNNGIEDNNKPRRKFIDRSCLDKCITNLLVDYSIDSFEAKNEFEASQYLLSVVSGLHEVQKRPISSKYKPKNTSGTNNNPWITQIMQIPGLSDDSARGIENVYKTPKELIRYIKGNIAKQRLISSKSNLLSESLDGYSNTLDIENSSWFNKLANITYFCSKGFCIRKLGKARARKLVILYGNLSLPSKMIGDQI